MSDWAGPSERLELRELRRESRGTDGVDRRWYFVAFLAGMALICIMGFATDLFDSGPTRLDVSAAYRDGFDQGTAAAESDWDEQVTDAWWEGYKRGQASDSSMAPVIVEAVRDGFSWESGYEAGLQSREVDLERTYYEGWMQGYSDAWAQVTGIPRGMQFIPNPTGSENAQRQQSPE